MAILAALQIDVVRPKSIIRPQFVAHNTMDIYTSRIVAAAAAAAADGDKGDASMRWR